jgi:hypothetical protein
VTLETQNSLQSALDQRSDAFDSLSSDLEEGLRGVNTGVQNIADMLDGIRLGEYAIYTFNHGYD